MLMTLLVFLSLGMSTTAHAELQELGQNRYRVGNWSDTDRNFFYYATTGGSLLPSDWLDALEAEDSDEIFTSPESLERLGFAVDRTGARPRVIGIAETVLKEKYYTPFDFTGKFRGFNCAACHTGELHYQGKVLYVDGGSGRVDAEKVIDGLRDSLADTANSPFKLWDFYANTTTGSLQLWGALQSYVYGFDSIAPAKHTEEGPGRSDTVAKGLSTLAFYKESNRQRIDAPVSIPSLWETHLFDSYHTSGSIRQTLGRDISATTGGGAATDFRPGDTQFNSAIDLKNLRKMEKLVEGLAVPAWPEKVLGRLDGDAAKRGRGHYQVHCASCHDPALVNGELKLKSVPLAEIGTDANAAKKFAETIVDATDIDLGYGPAPAFFQAATSGIQESYFRRNGFTAEQQKEFTKGRINTWKGPLAYKANPLKGIWATPPYLHNASVVSLRELLEAPEKRTPVFRMCVDTQYDPKTVGYVNNESRASCTSIDTRKKNSGNGNGGHLYGLELKPAQKDDLVQYLKTL